MIEGEGGNQYLPEGNFKSHSAARSYQTGLSLIEYRSLFYRALVQTFVVEGGANGGSRNEDYAQAGMGDLRPNWTNTGLFQLRFSEPKCTEI